MHLGLIHLGLMDTYRWGGVNLKVISHQIKLAGIDQILQINMLTSSEFTHKFASAKCFSDLLGVYINIYVVRSYSSEMLPCGKKGENLAKILTTQNILAFCAMFRHWRQQWCQLCVVTGRLSRDHRLVLSNGNEKGENSTRFMTSKFITRQFCMLLRFGFFKIKYQRLPPGR